MTNVAYLLFTFFACMIGLGVGLLLHHVWGKARATSAFQSDPFSSIAEGETSSWENFTKWQSDNNRRFAAQVVSCGALPVLVAGAAWTERSDVVKSICSTMTQVIGQAYICM